MIENHKIGDIVKLTTGIYEENTANPIWGGRYGKTPGIIIDIEADDSHPIKVAWQNNKTNLYQQDDLDFHYPDIKETTHKINNPIKCKKT